MTPALLAALALHLASAPTPEGPLEVQAVCAVDHGPGVPPCTWDPKRGDWVRPLAAPAALVVTVEQAVHQEAVGPTTLPPLVQQAQRVGQRTERLVDQIRAFLEVIEQRKGGERGRRPAADRP